MEAAIALAVFIGLPIAVLLLVVAAKRRHARKGGNGDAGWLAPRVAELEALAVSEDRWRRDVEQRLAALEQDRAPLYRAQ